MLPQGGLAPDIVRAAYKASGVEPTTRYLPWKRGYAALRGEFTATFPYLRNADHERELPFSVPLCPLRLMLFHLTSKGFVYTGLDSLKGKTTYIELGGTPQRAILSLIEAGDVTLVDTMDILTCVRMMGVVRVVFLIVNEEVGRTAVRDAALPTGVINMVEQPYALRNK